MGNGAGKNFGWPAFEGSVGGTCAGKTLGGPAPHTPPIVTVDRRGGSTSPFADYNSVIGGRVYRGTAMPTLAGVYFFADFTGGAMGAVRNCSGTFSAPAVIPALSGADDGNARDHQLLRAGARWRVVCNLQLRHDAPRAAGAPIGAALGLRGEVDAEEDADAVLRVGKNDEHFSIVVTKLRTRLEFLGLDAHLEGRRGARFGRTPRG